MKRKELLLHDDAAETFSEEYAILTQTETIVFDTIMKFFPDPAPTTTILQAIEKYYKTVPNYYSNNSIEVTVCRIRKKFKQQCLPYSIESLRNYGFMLVHPEIKSTWWTGLNEFERSVLLLLLESSSAYTYLRLLQELRPDQINPGRKDLNYAHTIITRIDRKLKLLLSPPNNLPSGGGKRSKFETLYDSDFNSYYTKERMIADLRASSITQTE